MGDVGARCAVFFEQRSEGHVRIAGVCFRETVQPCAEFAIGRFPIRSVEAVALDFARDLFNALAAAILAVAVEIWRDVFEEFPSAPRFLDLALCFHGTQSARIHKREIQAFLCEKPVARGTFTLET